jgi:predicted ribosomally synthesized peptide with SipW-like signal peptide
MSLRKIAVLLAAGGLAVGLIGGGVGAQFTDQVQAIQNINVGTFSCIISDGGGGTISADQKSVVYNPPTS